MNYEPYKTQWKPGDLVIHDADAKRPNMLMKVVGYTEDGRCETTYLNDMKAPCTKAVVWQNPIEVLHDPARFNIPLPRPRVPAPTLAEFRAALVKGLVLDARAIDDAEGFDGGKTLADTADAYRILFGEKEGGGA